MKSKLLAQRNSSFSPEFIPHRLSMPTDGFTLIEVIVVVALIGILASIGFPQFSKWNDAYRTKGAAQNLYADMQKSKAHAIKTNRKVEFNFTAIADCSGPTGYTFKDSKNNVVASETLDGGICLFSSDFSTTPGNISGYDPRGLQAEIPATLHTVKLKHKDRAREYEITQSMAGSVKIK